MSEIAELERRITAALERIGKGLEGLGRAAAPAGEAIASDERAALQAALDAERDANGKLTERLRALAEHDTARRVDLESQVERLTAQLDTQGLELQRMRKTVVQLRESLRGLTDAQVAGVTEPELLNKAMQTELEALRATRLTEVVELDAILAELQPLIAEVSHA